MLKMSAGDTVYHDADSELGENEGELLHSHSELVPMRPQCDVLPDCMHYRLMP